MARTLLELGTSGTLPPAESPRRRHQRCLALLGVLLSVSAACRDEGKPGWKFEGHVSRSRVWDYHARLDEPLCPTLLALLDEHAATVGGKLGLTVEAERPLHYYRFADRADLAAGCGGGVPACADGDAVLTVKPFDAHEQVHAYVARAWAVHSLGLLEEGEAVALSCDPNPGLPKGTAPRDGLGAGDWRPFLYLSGNSASGYAAAGYWVTYLARKYGWKKIEELHRRALPGMSADDFAIEFARVFPVSMDHAWSEALSGDSPSCEGGWICQATSLSPGETAQVSCDGELHRSIEVSSQAGVVLTHRRGLVLQNCADATSPARELSSGKSVTTSWVSLPPGSYAIPSIIGETASDVTFVSYLPTPFFAESCEQAGRVTLTSDRLNLVELVPGIVDGCLRLDGGGQTFNVGFQGFDFADGASATVCASSDADAACFAIPARGASTLTLGGDATLRLRNARAAPKPSDSMGRIVFFPIVPVDGGA